MASDKRLSSVCHNIADHATSGLSFIHPHLREACRSRGWYSIEIDLGMEDPCPAVFRKFPPLRLSLAALHQKFLEILRAEGFSPSDVNAITLRFEFSDDFPDDYCSICRATVTSDRGEVFRHSVNYLGESL